MLQISKESAWDLSMRLAGNDGNSDKLCRDTKKLWKKAARWFDFAWILQQLSYVGNYLDEHVITFQKVNKEHKSMNNDENKLMMTNMIIENLRFFNRQTLTIE